MIYSKQFLLPILSLDSVVFRGRPSEPSKRIAIHQCSKCFQENLRYDRKLDLMKCVHCGNHEIYVVSVNYVRSSRKILMARKYSPEHYKRLVHFRFWIKRLQGKESNKVTDEMIEKIRELMIKDNFQGCHYWNTRNAMKRLGYYNYYDHVCYIMSRIRGTPLVSLTKKQENILVQMFLEIQDAYLQVSEKRANMLSYAYIIKKLCELKNWNAMARIIPTLKSHIRIQLQDSLWRKVCQIKGWRFIPTAKFGALETRAPNRNKL